MSRKIFTREKLKILFYIVIYDILCKALSLVVLGLDWGFSIGLALGTITVMVNFIILEKVVDCALDRHKLLLAFLLHLGRFLLFGLAGYFSCTISITALIAYGIGILGLVMSIVFVYGRNMN